MAVDLDHGRIVDLHVAGHLRLRLGRSERRREKKRKRKPEDPARPFSRNGCMATPCPSWLLLHHHLGASDPPQNVDRNIRSVALQEDIDTGFANAERANDDPIQKVRQRRSPKADLLRVEIELEAQTGLQQRQRRSARPGLRRAGDRIERRPLAGVRRKPQNNSGGRRKSM